MPRGDSTECHGVHPAAILNALVAEAARWPDPLTFRVSTRQARLDRIRSLLAAGLKQRAIAGHLSLSESRISQILSDARQHPPSQVTNGNSLIHGERH